MKDLHWRYNFNTQQFDFVENNPRQHYEPLLKYVHVPTLVIDIYLVPAKNLNQYIRDVLDKTYQQKIQFCQIIFDATLDPLNNYTEVTRILNEFAKAESIKCYLSLSQFDLKQHSHLVEINYPAWLFVFKKQPLPEISFDDKKYNFSCLNRNPSWHRLLFYTMVKQSGLLDQFVYSFYDRCPYQGHKISSAWYNNLRGIAGEKLWQECLQNIQDFPISWNRETLGENDHSLMHDAYHNTWCNIVTETSATISFTSEKIWKPIAAGQLFLVVGAPGTTNWLKLLNINTFNDDYDNEPNIVKRLTTVIEVMREHADDPRAWWMKNKFFIEQNYYWFHSGNIEKMLLDPIIVQLNHK